eukprot:g4315.t1
MANTTGGRDIKKSSFNAFQIKQEKEIKILQKQCLAVKHETDWTELTLKRLSGEIERLKGLVKSYRRAIGGNSALDENRHRIKQQRNILENRLEIAQQQYTSKKQHLLKLKRRINVFRRDNMTLRRIGEKERSRMENAKAEQNRIANAVQRTRFDLEKAKEENVKARRSLKGMTLDFQVEMDRYKLSDTAKIEKPPPLIFSHAQDKGNLSKAEEEKIRQQIAASQSSRQRRNAMNNAKYRSISTYKKLTEMLMKLCRVESLEDLKDALLTNEERNFTLMKQINEQELELSMLKKEINARKSELRNVEEEKRGKAAKRQFKSQFRVEATHVIRQRSERKKVEIAQTKESIDKLSRTLHVYQETMKRIYVVVMEGVGEKKRPSVSSVATTASQAIVTRSKTKIPMIHEHLPDLDPHFWEKMQLSDLSPILLMQVIDVINIQLMDRICKFVKASSSSSKDFPSYLVDLAQNGPRTSRSCHKKTNIRELDDREKKLLDASKQSQTVSIRSFADPSNALLNIEECRRSMRKLLDTTDPCPIEPTTKIRVAVPGLIGSSRASVGVSNRKSSWATVLSSSSSSRPYARKSRSGRLRAAAQPRRKSLSIDRNRSSSGRLDAKKKTQGIATRGRGAEGMQYS